VQNRGSVFEFSVFANSGGFAVAFRRWAGNAESSDGAFRVDGATRSRSIRMLLGDQLPPAQQHAETTEFERSFLC